MEICFIFPVLYQVVFDSCNFTLPSRASTGLRTGDWTKLAAMVLPGFVV
jgi:hypothetical protein